ncbi:MAG: class I tRNA ligase family protein, partial [Patescibacteria group bacterium]|nr:class I tRNA ligase family protein [Patescibacteria group bacterium]
IKAVNPANNEEVPVWIADYVLPDYGTGAVMAVPAHDERDYAFAKKFGLPVKETVVPLITRTGDVDAWRPDEPEVKRPVVACIVKHWSEDKYLFLRKKIADKATVAIAGGIDGEDIVKAGLREIREESGYLNAKYVRSLGSPVYYRFYSLSGKQNRISDLTPLYFELENGEKEEVSEDEKKQHDAVWLSKPEIEAEYLKGRAFNLIFWKRMEGVYEPFVGNGIMIDSGMFTGRESASIMKEITAFAGGRWVTKYKLRDWVFSRQRYWGEPIPVIHCDKCGVVPVPEKDLPVKLPRVKSYEPTGTGESPLAAIGKWVNVKCPKCGGKGRRETNTMPQWAGSCWYYLR